MTTFISYHNLTNRCCSSELSPYLYLKSIIQVHVGQALLFLLTAIISVFSLHLREFAIMLLSSKDVNLKETNSCGFLSSTNLKINKNQTM